MLFLFSESTRYSTIQTTNYIGNNVPESEDGGSLLGSSRKSLADTSVTSTADLSVFSGGQRSQQAYDICIDDSRSVLSEADDDAENESPEYVLFYFSNKKKLLLILNKLMPL